ncbi:VPLPA-CTERM-specific exosortase XrtD [Pseudodesulfovibrio sp. zrk46]|uniref:VPLPA-CTERM-specific exosortase XrtD n=1 Tax=Pseudodesulfovibrio sp. zrk46 TaxID=2725288 RepID=UPI001448D54F|nr:VPLPA-CTERM-specific exosortase XrtD [Pseudodesulfovibrio sp. zrk46]QJB55321.1 VPLPA-CTERM-specific exosortase XrtD [Pseudodesulfovibrio sp. zrk46]
MQMIRLSGYLVAFVVWIAVFWSDFGVLINEWDQPDYSHCYLVLPIVAYLLWSERSKIARAMGGGISLGVVCLVFSFAAFYVGRLGSLKFFVYVSMWSSLCGLGLLALGNRSARAMWMPILIGLFAIPFPPFITRLVSLKLRLVSSVISEKMLKVVGVPVYRDGNVIDLGAIQLQVVDACSGLRYLWPSILMALLIGWFFLSKPMRRLFLVLIAIPVTIFSNAFRIALTGVLSKYIDPSLAEGFFHDFSGWLVYVFSLLIMGACAYFMRSEAPAEMIPEPTPPAKNVSWEPGILGCCVLGIMLLGQMFYFTMEKRPERKDFTSFPMQIGEWDGQREYLSKPVLKSLGADDYVNVVYRNNETGDVVYLLVSWYDHQTTSHAAHAPTSCLVGGGWGIMSKTQLPAVAGEGRSFPVAQMIMDRNGQKMISNFWLLQRGKIVVNEWWNKWHLLKDAVVLKRTDGALVRIEMPVRQGESVLESQQLLDAFASRLQQTLAGYLPVEYNRQSM